MGLFVDETLRLIRHYTDMLDGNATRALVLLAASRAGTRRVRGGLGETRSGYIDDALRRPTTIAALARSLAMPPETVRRHVSALVRDGYASRLADGGVLVLSEHFAHPRIREAVDDAVTGIDRLCALPGVLTGRSDGLDAQQKASPEDDPEKDKRG